MSTSDTETLTRSALTPSEIAYFNVDQYEGLSGGKLKRFLGASIPLLHDADRKVPANDVGLATLATAVLANEKAGAVKLDVRQKKEMFGLRKVQTVYVEPTGADVAWPQGSLEERVLAVARAAQSEKTREADAVLASVIGEDSSDPWQHIVEKMFQGMHARDLLVKEEKRTLKIFRTESWALPEPTLALARAAPLDPVKDLVDSTRIGRPELWYILVREINQAVARRTERDDDGPDFD